MRAFFPMLGVVAVAAGVTAAGSLVAPDPATARPAAAVPTTAVPATGTPAVAGTAPQRAPGTVPRRALGTGVPAEPPANRPVGPDPQPPGGGAAGQADTLESTRVATRGRGRLIASTLTGDVVVPRKGDPRGVGVAALRVEPGRICLEAVFTGTPSITSTTLHRGRRGTAGGTVARFPMAGPQRAAGCVRVSPALTGVILQDPENYHLLAGTERFGGAALRGQLMW